MENTSSHLDDYSKKTGENPNYIAYDMLDCGTGQNCAEDLLAKGEGIINKCEKQKEMPQLIGFENVYSQIQPIFDPNVEKKLQSICKIIGQQGVDSTADYTNNNVTNVT